MTHAAREIRAADVLLSDYMAVRAGENLLITADTGTDPAVPQVIFAMAERIGARPTIMTAPRLPFQGQLSDAYVARPQAEAMKACDVWIDLAFPYFAGSHVHDAAMKTGHVRYLLAGDMGAASFGRLFGLIDLDQHYEAKQGFDAVFAAGEGKRCRVTTRNGTDVSFELTKSALRKPRRADGPGMYLVPGSCSIAPKIETVRGKIVVIASFHEFYELLPNPITLMVDGPVTSLSGGGPSRLPLDRAMRRAGRGEYGSVIHFSHGLHPAARFTGKSFIEDMRAIGSNAVGLGIPWWEPGGGENHPDTVLSEQSVWIEAEKIIEDGVIIAPASLAERAGRLAPLIDCPKELA